MHPDSDQLFDLLIVGGGINGVGIARDAAGRGLSVLLVEQDDLASHTSSASTKLIHGGLRYLELGDFRLVRESLIERERLLAIAPHIIHPLDFVVPQAGSLRPAWLVRLGLFLYDHLGGRRRLRPTRTIRLSRHPFGDALRDRAGKAFVYSDCRADDSRLVVLNALDARERGAEIRTRTSLIEAHRESGYWSAALRDQQGEHRVRSRALVNAAGPWVGELFKHLRAVEPRRKVRLVKGSHIVLPRLYSGEHAVVIQNRDRRIVFAIPFEGEFTAVGTTDKWWTSSPGQAVIDDDEIAYLLETASRTFARDVSVDDIRWSWSGIRPLYDDGASSASTITRDYLLDLDQDGPPLLSIYGGKITTYRRLAEQALERLRPIFTSVAPAWTGTATLPGAERIDLGAAYPALPSALLQRLAASYGSRAERLLGDARTLGDLGDSFGAGLTAREVDYLIDEEWARSADDILFRRSKLGIRMAPDDAARLQRYVEDRLRRGASRTRTDNAA